MDIVPFLTGFAGFMAGLLVLGRVIRWVYTLRTVSQERKRDPAHRSRWRLVAAALLDSGPWMFAVLLVMSVVILPKPHQAGWNTFFYGVLASLLVQGAMIFLIYLKWRARRSSL